MELRTLYEWVMSDGVLRTHDEIVDEMFSALPFSRRGARIEAALRQGISRSERKWVHYRQGTNHGRAQMWILGFSVRSLFLGPFWGPAIY